MRIPHVFLVVLLISAGLLLASPPVMAADTASGTAQVSPVTVASSCTLNIGLTSKVGASIRGYGSISTGCTPSSTAELRIRRLRALGIWQTVASTTIYGTGHDVFLYYGCAGTGTYTYLTEILTYGIDGFIQSKTSNKIRVSC